MVEMTCKRIKVIFVCDNHQDIYTVLEMMPHVDLHTSNTIKTLLSGNAHKQKVEDILKAALNRVCPTRSPGKLR